MCGVNRNDDGQTLRRRGLRWRRARWPGHITPVPGGVGPMTITMLLVNTHGSCRARRRRAWPCLITPTARICTVLNRTLRTMNPLLQQRPVPFSTSITAQLHVGPAVDALLGQGRCRVWRQVTAARSFPAAVGRPSRAVLDVATERLGLSLGRRKPPQQRGRQPRAACRLQRGPAHG